MANTYQLISSNTVGSGGTGSITFSSIPSTYTDLNLICSVRGNNAANYQIGKITFNGATTGFSTTILEGTGSAVSSYAGGDLSFVIGDGANQTASTFGNVSIYIPNYAGSTAKSVSVDSVNENNATAAYALLVAGLWTGTAAITSIDIASSGGVSTFNQYSSFYLYGIKNS
jgi:hypothetical protein